MNDLDHARASVLASLLAPRDHASDNVPLKVQWAESIVAAHQWYVKQQDKGAAVHLERFLNHCSNTAT